MISSCKDGMDLAQAYSCDLCGRREPRALIEAAKVPIMHGMLIDHQEPPSIDFLKCASTDKHCCSKCLRAMQCTFQMPQDVMVLRSRG